MFFGRVFIITVTICSGLIGAENSVGREVLHHDTLVETSEPKVCLDCHQSLDGSGKYHCAASAHPVFVSYPADAQKAYFSSPDEIEAAGIKLLRGQVACTSCHDPGNDQKHHLVIDNHHSRLCLTCHSRFRRQHFSTP